MQVVVRISGNNLIMVMQSNSLSGSESLVVSQVTQALRDYDAVGFGGVRVLLDRGVITLTENVPNWYFRSLAYQLASRLPLASHVVDALRVRQSSRAAVSIR